jgi:hypothetical protein
VTIVGVVMIESAVGIPLRRVFRYAGMYVRQVKVEAR